MGTTKSQSRERRTFCSPSRSEWRDNGHGPLLGRARSPAVLGVGLRLRQPGGAATLHQVALHAGRLNRQLVDLVFAFLHRRRLQRFLQTREIAGCGERQQGTF